MLAEKDLDIVLIATPDHWHALPMIEAIKAGADIYVQKPISVDVVEGQAMLAAARKHKRVVQVGTQRRSTPHLIEARDRVISEGKLGKIGLRRNLLLLPHAGARESARREPARESRLRNVDRPGADAALQRARAPAELARVHGVRQRHRRRHVRPHARHGALDAGPRLAGAHHVVRRHPRRQGQQGQHHRHADGDVRFRRLCRSCGRTARYGDPPDPKYPWGATFYGDKGTLKASVMSYDFFPRRKDDAHPRRRHYELEQYPEDQTEKDLEKHVAPAIRGHMRDLLEYIATRGRRWPTSSRAISPRPPASSPTCPCRLGRSLTWDHARGVVVGDEEANRLLRRPYRGPWVHPG